MKADDIKLIRKFLIKDGHDELAELIKNANGEVDQSSTYGSYLFSVISQYLFFLPLDNFHRSRNISEADKNILLNAVLYLYPHQAEAPEIRTIDFRILRESPEELIEVHIENKIDHDFAAEQLDKCELKIEAQDYDGAISSAGSLLEGVFEDIYKRCTGKEIWSIADLRFGYKKIKSLLRLSDEEYSNQSAQSVLRGLTAIVAGLDALRNQLGDRHSRLSKPWRRHAKVCVNSTKVVVDFLYDTLVDQLEKEVGLYKELIDLLDGERRGLSKEELLNDSTINKYLSEIDEFLKVSIKIRFIKHFTIDRYRASDIFFCAMGIFFDCLTTDDIKNIFNNCKNNDQAWGLIKFLELVRSEEAELLNDEIIYYLDKIQKKEAQLIS